MSRMNSRSLTILVPDSPFWVTGRIARMLSTKLIGTNREVLICSGNVLFDLIQHQPELPSHTALIHFLTPHLATIFKEYFLNSTAFVSTVHHIEDKFSIEPVEYSDAIMTVSRQWHDELIRVGVPESKLTMIQNGIDVKLFGSASHERKQMLRWKYGLNVSDFVVGFSAKRTSDTCHRKGIDVLQALIKTTSALEGRSLSWFLRGPGWNELVDSMRKNGARITYCPFLETDEELAESYQLLDSFVITARIEGGPVPLLEAMSCGIAVITTPVGVAREIVEDSHNGFLVEFDSPDRTVKRIFQLYRDRSLAARFGIEARRTIVQRLRWEETTKDVAQLYSVAEANFLRRQPDGYHTKRIQQLAHNSIKSIQRWIYARECGYFARFLAGEGAVEAAERMANKAVLYAPFDVGVLKLAGHISGFRMPYRALGFVISSIKNLIRKGLPSKS